MKTRSILIALGGLGLLGALLWFSGLGLVGLFIVLSTWENRGSPTIRLNVSKGAAYCREVRFAEGWDNPHDPTRAPGYFQSDPTAVLGFHLADAAKSEVFAGLKLASPGRPDEYSTRQYRLHLTGDERPRAVGPDEWRSSAEILTHHGFWLDRAPYVEQSRNKLEFRSPDGRFTTSVSHTGATQPGWFGDHRKGTIAIEIGQVYPAGKLITIRGNFRKVDPGALLQTATWISDRHFALSSALDYSQMLLCDLDKGAPTQPVLDTVPTQAELIGFDTAQGFSAITRLPMAGEARWRVRNPAGTAVFVNAALDQRPEDFRPGLYTLLAAIPALGDGPYRIDQFSFRGAVEGAPAPDISFLTPPYRHRLAVSTEVDHTDTPDLIEKKPMPGGISDPKGYSLNVDFSDTVKPEEQGQTTIYTIDCKSERQPPPIVPYFGVSNIPGAKVNAKPDKGPCIEAAAKLTFTPPAAAPAGRYSFGVTLLGGFSYGGTRKYWIANGPPNVVGLSPASGAGAVGRWQVTLADPNGTSDVRRLDWLIAESEKDTAPGCLVIEGKSQTPACTVESNAHDLSGITIRFLRPQNLDQNVYVQAYDEQGSTSGWRKMGTWKVTHNEAPTPIAVAPYSGAGNRQTLQIFVADPNGPGDIARTEILVAFDLQADKRCAITIAGGVRNVDTESCAATISPPDTTSGLWRTTIQLERKAALQGRQNIYVRTTDRAGLQSSWRWLATQK